MKVKNITWHKDELGFFWTADLLNRDGQKMGIVGNYYDVNERDLSKEDQLKLAGLDIASPSRSSDVAVFTR